MATSYEFGVFDNMRALMAGILVLLVLVVLTVLNYKFERQKLAKRLKYIKGKGGVQV